eukprot:1154088-Pelagomonas_calceolata.AAC.11
MRRAAHLLHRIQHTPAPPGLQCLHCHIAACWPAEQSCASFLQTCNRAASTEGEERSVPLSEVLAVLTIQTGLIIHARHFLPHKFPCIYTRSRLKTTAHIWLPRPFIPRRPAPSAILAITAMPAGTQQKVH